MAVRLLIASLALASGVKRRASVPSEDCIVTSTSVDGTEETRDCFILSEKETKPGTRGKFQSCTQ